LEESSEDIMKVIQDYLDNEEEAKKLSKENVV